MINLTKNAITAVSRYLDNSDKPNARLRIEVTDGGCSGLQYGLRLEQEKSESDTVMEYGSVKVLVDSESMPMLDGMTVDFVDSLEGSGFRFTNPNAAKSCACGTSFSTSDNGSTAKTCS